MIRKFIPNAITSLNLVCGVLGILMAFSHRLDLSFYLMLGAAVFDFLDGAAARALGAYSDLGKELDSLCDLVSFGVLPSIMLFVWSDELLMGHWAAYVPLLVSVFSAFRLAKFNIDTRQTSSFLGLPTPACAMLVGSYVYYMYMVPFSSLKIFSPALIVISTLVLCVLLVCELPMFSMKFHKDDPKPLVIKRLAFLGVIALAVVACLVFSLNWSAAVIFTFLAYILKNLVYAILKV